MTSKMHSAQLLSPALLRAIGHVAVESAYLDHLAASLIQSVCRFGAEQQTFFVVTLSLDKRLDALKALVAQFAKPGVDTTSVNRLLSKARELAAQRNTVIHGQWYPPRMTKTDDFTIVGEGEPRGSKPGRNGKRQAISAKEVIAVAEALHEVRHALYGAFSRSIDWDALPPLRAPQRYPSATPNSSGSPDSSPKARP